MVSGLNGKNMPSPRLVFKDLCFAVIPSEDLEYEQVLHIIEEVESYGAKTCSLDSAKLQDVTHLIATTSDFPAYHDALDAFIHVVTPKWIEQSILKGKPANPRQYSPDPSLFLSDVTVCCADDIPSGDKEAVISGIVAMGGHYSQFMSKIVTHIVALSPENPQCRIAEEKNLDCKQVLPHWFQECLKLGKKIDAGPYLLPKPSILEGKTQPPTARSPIDLRDASCLSPGPLLLSGSGPSLLRTQLSVFKNKTVLFNRDLSLSEHLKSTMQEIIENGGGSCVEQVMDADMIICQFRSGEDFIQATRAGKDIGNLTWLYNLINYNRWTSPTRRLLHYPLPVEGNPGEQDFRIGISGTQDMVFSVSNFAGEARIYLESLVRAFGGKYTKTLSPENTHLITAHPTGDKYAAAREWNVNVVNHLWLEESYAKASIQSISLQRYITFPQQTNLGEVLGQTQIDRKATTSTFAYQSSSQGGTLGDLDPNPEIKSQHSGSIDGLTPRQQRVEQNSLLSPVGPGQENQPRESTRSAKARALNKLHSMASDIAIFEKESKRVGGVIYGGRKTSDPDRILLNKRKRGIEREETKAEADAHVPHKEPNSRKRFNNSSKESLDEPFLRILVTGHPIDKRAQKTLKKLNVELASDSSEKIDILVAPRLSRTKKFLSALGYGPAIISSEWIDRMVEHQKRLSWEQYTLQDEEGEKNYGVSLNKIDKLAKQHQSEGGLLNGWTMYCTENVRAGFDTYREIATANGGTCLVYRGRETLLLQGHARIKPNVESNTIFKGVHKAASQNPQKCVYLISDLADKDLWPKFQEMGKESGYVPLIVAPDWFLDIIMKQDTSLWDEQYVYHL